MYRDARPARAKTGCVSDVTAHDCTRCCATALTHFWPGSVNSRCRSAATSWSLVEASWVAIGCSPYFGSLYRQHRARGKKANTAILIVARRMCRIIWQLLEQKRDFEKRAPRPKLYSFPGCSALALTVNPALAS